MKDTELFVREYKFNIYPCSLWVTEETNITKLSSKFHFCKRDNLYQIDDDIMGIQNELDNDSIESACIPVIDKDTNCIGILMIIIRSIPISVIAHESVHIADYVFQLCDINSEDFRDGNEHYAYLVGWIAEQISNFLYE